MHRPNLNASQPRSGTARFANGNDNQGAAAGVYVTAHEGSAAVVRDVGLRLVCLASSLALMGGCQAEGTASISARVALSGGPITPSGGMALDHVGAVGVEVTARAAGGATWTATTDAKGEATLLVPPGSYDVSSIGCPARHVRARSKRAVSVSIECAVP